MYKRYHIIFIIFCLFLNNEHKVVSTTYWNTRMDVNRSPNMWFMFSRHFCIVYWYKIRAFCKFMELPSSIYFVQFMSYFFNKMSLGIKRRELWCNFHRKQQNLSLKENILINNSSKSSPVNNGEMYVFFIGTKIIEDLNLSTRQLNKNTCG